MEIKANELRLGNFVDYERTTHFVASINAKSIKTFWKGNNRIDEYEDFAFNYQPIPLTEDWLLRLGFKKTSCIGYFDKKWLSGDFFFDGKKLLVITEGLIDGDFIDIEYVHQLQNLFFALTGEELTIKN